MNIPFKKIRTFIDSLDEITSITNSFDLKGFKKKIEKNIGDFTANEKDLLFVNLILKVKNTKKTNQIMDATIYNEILKVLTQYYLDGKPERNKEFDLLLSTDEFTIKDYFVLIGAVDYLDGRYIILKNKVRINPLTEYLEYEDDIVVLPTLKGGNQFLTIFPK
jgi:hypothetical protein